MREHVTMGNRHSHRRLSYAERRKLSRSVSEPEAFERSWSRTSRRRPRSSTLANPYAASLTRWPVPQVEAVFLPEYEVKHYMAQTHFEVLHPLSKGAFGQVLKVQKLDDKKFYAMKIMSKSEVIKTEIVKQCKQEALIQSVLCSHPFLVKAHSTWQTRTHLYLVFDYLDHGDLFTLWTIEGQFNEESVRVYAAEIALALDFLHSAGCLYRDLKMENILLDEEGHVKLADFGLARWLSRGYRARTICGTMQYMAPEALNPEEPYSYPVDWWSLGVVMFAMITGTFPVPAADTHLEMYKNIMACSYDMPNYVSIGAKNVIKGLLAKDVSRRLQSLTVFKRQDFFLRLSFDDVLDRRISPRSKMAMKQGDSRQYKSMPNIVKHTTDKKDLNRHSAIPNIEEAMLENFDWVNPSLTGK
ncbi:ribosomal protein S6 kinase-related protein-like [Ptychodera flava]|uniref:ribosomal protein S6 kinase-related protein-like n=1 Tax=Ptychodera flava TaxID=63121 RepID=UPI00396A0EEC